MKIVTAKYLPFGGIPERPSDPARFVLDASNAASITLGTQLGIPNKVLSWTSTGTNTASATGSITANTSPVYDATNKCVVFSAGGVGAYHLSLGSVAGVASTANWHIFAVVNIANITRSFGDGQAWANHSVFSFAQYGGLFVGVPGGTRVAQAHVYDGAHKQANASTVPLNTKVLLEAKSTGIVAAAAINGGAFTSSGSAGATANSTSWPTNMGWSYGSGVGTLNGSIHEVVVFGDDLTDARRDLWTAHLKGKWGVS